jgi:uncharacterized membrane protein
MRTTARIFLVLLFFAASLVHFCRPELFIPVMPPQIPYPRACILISGVAELLGAIGLLVRARLVQALTGWWLTLMLIAVFPANIYMAVAHIQVHGFPPQPWIAWARLALQPLLIALVLWVTRAWSGICMPNGKCN